MDTKSKRFDKLLIIKFICIVLSLIFAVAGTFNLSKLAVYLIENDKGEEALNIIGDAFVGNEGEQNSAFWGEYNKFLDTALSQSFVYTSPDEKGYKLFCERLKEKYCEGLTDTLLQSRDTRTDFFIFYALEQGYISLDRIGEYCINDRGTFYYENGTGYKRWDSRAQYSGDNSFELPHELYDDEDEDDDDEDEDEDDVVVTTSFPGETSGNGKAPYLTSYRYSLNDYFENLNNSYDYGDYNYALLQNKHGAKYLADTFILDAKILDEVKADLIIRVDKSYFGGKEYGGVYAVTINKDKINISSPDEIFTRACGTYDTSEEKYLENVEACKAKLSQYKNMFYAVYDATSGIFTTNLEGTFGEENKESVVEELLSGFDKNYVIKYSGASNASWSGEFQRRSINSASDFVKRCVPDNVNYTVWVAYDTSLSATDPFSKIDLTGFEVEQMLKTKLICFGVCAFGYLICLAVLIILSGRKSYDDELYMGRFDVIFPGLKTVFNLGLVALAVWFAVMMAYEGSYRYSADGVYRITVPAAFTPIVCILGGLCSLLLTDLMLYFARHIKNHSLLKSISFVRLISFIIKIHKKKKAEKDNAPKEYKDYKKKVLPIFASILAAVNIVAFVTIIVAADHDGAFALLIPVLLIFDIFCVWLVMRYIRSIKYIFSTIHKMRMGENNAYVEKKGMPTSLSAYADDLNSVSDGLKIAVENATKEQRTKTELITNISHDLKTPLTSITNYVDLLSKRPIDDEEALRYIEVLGEKSEKLKKLIIDLVEASKASTGNVQVNMVKMSMHELISQMVGEYEDDFDSIGLSVVIEEKLGDITVDADSKLACRVIDNLMINIKKYALPGTRVYIRLFKDDDYGCIAMSNISREQLNIPTSELKERFVRGDSSRHTEGSGLGLAIAEDFMTVQGGKLDLFINGDMFTALIKFKINE